eukprot:CAMPEP_0197530770 /NCGR_PEP_ID=MMETSP1318-20131121/32860_1 /TAXON_ID=552666 /ORGANISM="Partenskyella glossopodia, Strain RCC365" /LENGTH=450 /DNA_ID=CAMNT_0043086735 /DNA_START=78 /DNA_END=1430 /DNA_ORIENTATION=+
MGWMATCGYIAATRFAREDMVLRYIDQISFVNPVTLADRFTVKAVVNYAFHDCVEVGARAECHSLGKESRHALSAYFIFSTKNQSAINFNLVPLSTVEKRRHKEALGRKRVRLRRQQVGIGHGIGHDGDNEHEYTERNSLGLIYSNITTCMRVYNRKLVKKSWTIHYRSQNVEIATQTGKDGITCFRATTSFVCVPSFCFECLLDFITYRNKWDLVYQKGKIIKKIDETNDIIHMVMATGKSKPKDFCLLRSYRHDASDFWILSFKSITHPDCPPTSQYERSFIHSSGYIIRRKNPVKHQDVEFEPKGLGITLKGMSILEVNEEGQAKENGVKKGWLITHVNGVRVCDHPSLKEEVSIALKKGQKFRVTFECPQKAPSLLSSSFRRRGASQSSRQVVEDSKVSQKLELTYLVQFRDSKAIELAMGDMVGYNRVIVRSLEQFKRLVEQGDV